MNARETATLFQLNVYERGTFSVKMAYKGVRGRTTRGASHVGNLAEYSLGYAVTVLVSLTWSALFDKPVKYKSKFMFSRL